MSQPHTHSNNSSFTSCFFPTNSDHHRTSDPPPPPPPPPPVTMSGKPNLSTSLYNNHLGLFSLTWSRTFLGHSLHLDHHPLDYNNNNNNNINSSPISSCSNNSSSFSSHSSFSFHLHIKPFLFWKKHGSKKLRNNNHVQLFWDLSKARFGSGPEPQSGFYIAVVVDGEMALVVGDCIKEAYEKTKLAPHHHQKEKLVLRREHFFGNKVYTTKAKFGGKTRDISIECSTSKSNDDAKLSFRVDNVRVLEIKRLKWKFRGNERIEVDGVHIQISWDVYNWLFDDHHIKNNNNNINNIKGHAAFMFRLEEGLDINNNINYEEQEREQAEAATWQLQQSSSSIGIMSGIEWRKMRKSLMMMRTDRSSSSSSISMSSCSSGCSSSVMEWASTEESELSPGPNAFSLLLYVWKK